MPPRGRSWLAAASVLPAICNIHTPRPTTSHRTHVCTHPCMLNLRAACMQGPRCPLATRILFHCARSRGDDDALMAHHSSLTNSLEDQLSLAALHYNRGHYQVSARMLETVVSHSQRVGHAHELCVLNALALAATAARPAVRALSPHGSQFG